jgi:hypothetical protein
MAFIVHILIQFSVRTYKEPPSLPVDPIWLPEDA